MVDHLVIAPPVTTPSEPPSGAFVLAAGLTARGLDAPLLDLSLEYFHWVLGGRSGFTPRARVDSALEYLVGTSTGYDPQRHRSVAGVIHSALTDWGRQTDGWRITLMDVVPPTGVHELDKLRAIIEAGNDPFRRFWEEVLGPRLDDLAPPSVLLSLSYLSQLPAALSLVGYLDERRIPWLAGGSLPMSLAATGHGFGAIEAHFPHLALGDGSALVGEPEGSLRHALAWPRFLSDEPYLTGRPIIPLSLSTGCFWNRCLFCPDRGLAFSLAPEEAVGRFLETVPPEVMAQGPVVHFLDSAVPPRPLRRLLPELERRSLPWYGFARPTKALLGPNGLDDLARGGAAMLQLGVESGSRPLLDRYDKGLSPREAAAVVDAAAAAGIRTYVYLLFGLPGETDEDRTLTRALVDERLDNIDFINLSLFNLPRTCELTDRAAEFGIEPKHRADAPGLIHLYLPYTEGGVNPRPAARRFMMDDLGKDPRIKEVIQRTPRWLRAAHLALMDLPGRRPWSDLPPG